MKKLIIFQAVLLTALIVASPVYAQSADVAKIQTFVKNIIQIGVTLAGLIAAGYMVWGGYRYITSSGSPEALDGAKKTLMYACIGLMVVLGAYMLTNMVSELAVTAFGGTP